MKKIFIVLLIVLGTIAVRAQSNPFPNTDSLERFINRYIRNSAVEAFQNLRLNTVLLGMLRFVDTAGNSHVVNFTRTVDTLRIITSTDTFNLTIPGISAIPDTTGFSQKLDSVLITTASSPDPDTLWECASGLCLLRGYIPKGGITELTGVLLAGPGSGSQPGTIATNAITNTMIRQSAALSILGNPSNVLDDILDISASNDHSILRRFGTSLNFGSINLASSNAVGTSILGIANGGSGTATPSLVAGTNISITGTWPNQTINSTGGGITQGQLDDSTAALRTYIDGLQDSITVVSVGDSGTALVYAENDSLKTRLLNVTGNASIATNADGSVTIDVTGGGGGAGTLKGSLTASRVPYAVASDSLADEAALTYDATANKLTADTMQAKRFVGAGEGNTSSSWSMLLNNSDNARLIQVYDNQRLYIGTGNYQSGNTDALSVTGGIRSSTGFRLRAVNVGDQDDGLFLVSGSLPAIRVANVTVATFRSIGAAVVANGNLRVTDTWNETSGTSAIKKKGFQSSITFSPSAGATEGIGFMFDGTINQTGTATGISRGFYNAPTLTSAVDFRAFESTTGKIIFNGLPTAFGSYKLKVQNPDSTEGTIDPSGFINTNLATDNLTQDAEARTYDANSQNLAFSNVNIFALATNASVAIAPTTYSFLDNGFHIKHSQNTDANLTVTEAHNSIYQDTITADRTYTMPTVNTGAIGSAQLKIKIDNYENGFHILLSGTTVLDSWGNTITQLDNKTSYILEGENNGLLNYWKIVSVNGLPPTTVSSAGTLTLAYNTHKEAHYVFTGTTSTWTMPAISATRPGFAFYLKNRGSGTVTINSNGGGNDFYTTSAVNTYALTAGSAIVLLNDGTIFNIE